ncbi:hypothetical protein [Chitinophaga rhizosphaerae]|uniref:hypothetical protein n=1 Tax=Chitinophaga rhizosphaerae TaxID=1864947 RepID=UPI000F8128C9|nr:hypothetical protein [Chitinophaga rhizosphaerae]
MKKLFLLAFAAGLFAACNNNASNNTDSTAVPTDSPAMEEPTLTPPDTSMQATDSTSLTPAPATDSAAPKQ